MSLDQHPGLVLLSNSAFPLRKAAAVRWQGLQGSVARGGDQQGSVLAPCPFVIGTQSTQVFKAYLPFPWSRLTRARGRRLHAMRVTLSALDATTATSTRAHTPLSLLSPCLSTTSSVAMRRLHCECLPSEVLIILS